MLLIIIISLVILIYILIYIYGFCGYRDPQLIRLIVSWLHMVYGVAYNIFMIRYDGVRFYIFYLFFLLIYSTFAVIERIFRSIGRSVLWLTPLEFIIFWVCLFIVLNVVVTFV